METEKKSCNICNQKVDDDVLLGEILTVKNITVHYFCLLLATDFCQRGKDKTGIRGFLLNDIAKGIKIINNKVCIYCKEKKASIKCNSCDKYFHLLCGITNRAQNEFCGNYFSYCHNHTKFVSEKEHDELDACRICHKRMGDYHPITSIMGNCCGFGWIHQLCLKKYALSAGYLLKCLWCNSPDFRDQVRKQGIYVPDKDASWENIGTFDDFHQRYSKCDAVECLNSLGRKNIQKNPNNKWYIMVCDTCGSNGIHKRCFRENKEEYTCQSCKTIIQNKLVDDASDTLIKLYVHDDEKKEIIGSVLARVDKKNINKSVFRAEELKIEEKMMFMNTEIEIDLDILKTCIEEAKNRKK